jgi:hypothetical protein
MDYNLPIYASCVAGVTGICHHTQLLSIEMGSCTHFLPRLAVTMILLTSASCVISITGVSHCTQPRILTSYSLGNESSIFEFIHQQPYKALSFVAAYGLPVLDSEEFQEL